MTQDHITALDYSKSDITADDFQTLLKKSIISGRHNKQTSSMTNLAFGQDLVSNNDTFDFSQLQQTPSQLGYKMAPIEETTDEAENHFREYTPIKSGSRGHKRDYSVPQASPLLGFAGKVRKENYSIHSRRQLSQHSYAGI